MVEIRSSEDRHPEHWRTQRVRACALPPREFKKYVLDRARLENVLADIAKSNMRLEHEHIIGHWTGGYVENKGAGDALYVEGHVWSPAQVEKDRIEFQKDVRASILRGEYPSVSIGMSLVDFVSGKKDTYVTEISVVKAPLFSGANVMEVRASGEHVNSRYLLAPVEAVDDSSSEAPRGPHTMSPPQPPSQPEPAAAPGGAPAEAAPSTPGIRFTADGKIVSEPKPGELVLPPDLSPEVAKILQEQHQKIMQQRDEQIRQRDEQIRALSTEVQLSQEEYRKAKQPQLERVAQVLKSLNQEPANVMPAFEKLATTRLPEYMNHWQAIHSMANAHHEMLQRLSDQEKENQELKRKHEDTIARMQAIKASATQAGVRLNIPDDQSSAPTDEAASSSKGLIDVLDSRKRQHREEVAAVQDVRASVANELFPLTTSGQQTYLMDLYRHSYASNGLRSGVNDQMIKDCQRAQTDYENGQLRYPPGLVIYGTPSASAYQK